MDERVPPSALETRWRELLEDAEAVATRYREDGRETLLLSPGDVAPLAGDPYGLDVLVPAEEFETLEALVETVTFDASSVYRDDEAGVRFLIVAVEAADGDVAVVVPTYFDPADAANLRERALEEGTTYTHVRTQSADSRVTFSHDDPELFF